ncbi:Subtilisin serine protease, partial [Globisporangium splendens]
MLRLAASCALLLFSSTISAASDAPQWTVDAQGVAFVSRDAFCAYHCKPTHVRRAYRELRAASECTRAQCGDAAGDNGEQRIRGRRTQEAVEGGASSRFSSSGGSSSAGRPTSFDFSTYTGDDGDAGNAEAHAASQVEEKEVEIVDFVSCQGVERDSSTKIALAVSGDARQSPFAGFYEAFFRAYDAMVASADAKYDACQLQFFQQEFLQNYTRSDKDADPDKLKPMLVKLNSTVTSAASSSSSSRSASSSSEDSDKDVKMTELQCVRAIRAVWSAEDEQLTPFLTRSDQMDANATIMLVHVSTNVAEDILDLDCVASVTTLPAILKLTPFARSAYSLAQNPSGSSAGPALEIRLIKGNTEESYNATLTRLVAAIRAVTGIANVLTRAHDDSARILKLAPLEEFETWTHIVAILLDDDAVEWVDLKQTITTGALQPYASFEQRLLTMSRDSEVGSHLRGHGHHRRLDNYIQDLVGVNDMQNNNITGAGIVVGVTDTGLYLDHDQFDQTSRAIYNQVDASARKVVLYRTFANKVDESENVVCGHGTHVSGILAGNSYSKSASNLGIAYDAQIAFMDIGKQAATCAGQKGCEVTLETPGEVEDLMNQQVAAGAKIFSFSWGTGGNDYNTQSRDLDNYIYNNPETLIIVAAGNSGDKGAHTISSPSGAKNVLSIGASLNDALSFTSTPCPAVLNKQTVASFSSIGPTLDGRQKPDLVAPGMAVDSAQSEAPGSTTKSASICSLQGTSQATPVVAGMAVLLYEWLRDGWWKNGVKDPAYAMTTIPASLLKALLIHSGEKLVRRLVAPKNGITSCVAMETQAIPLTSYPDFNQGYGKPTMLNLANFSNGVNGTGGAAGVYFYPNSTAGSEPSVVEGGEARFSFVLTQHANLRVTLVWTDPAGSMGGKIALQNDLDLSVRIPNTDTVFYPLSGNGTRDGKNNVEMVEVTYEEIVAAAKDQGVSIDSTKGLTVEAVVHGYSVKAGSKTGQTFALVASSSPSVVETNSMSNEDSPFWQPWMTIGTVIVGTLSVLFLTAVVWRVRMTRAAMNGKNNHAQSNNMLNPTHSQQYQPPGASAQVRGGATAAPSQTRAANAPALGPIAAPSRTRPGTSAGGAAGAPSRIRDAPVPVSTPVAAPSRTREAPAPVAPSRARGTSAGAVGAPNQTHRSPETGAPSRARAATNASGPGRANRGAGATTSAGRTRAATNAVFSRPRGSRHDGVFVL